MSELKVSEYAPVSLRDLFYVVLKYRRGMLAIIGSTLIITLGYLLYVSPMYTAETKILVKMGKEKFSAIDAYNKAAYNVLFQERGQNINNEIEIITDPFMAKAVFEELKPYLTHQPPPPESLYKKIKLAIKTLGKTVKTWAKEPLYWVGLKTRVSEDEMMERAIREFLHVEFIEDTDIIKLSFVWDNPDFAALAANTYAKKYIEQRIQVHESKDSQQFYIDQIEIFDNKLKENQGRITAFKKSSGIINIDLQKDLVLQEISELEQLFGTIKIEHVENSAKKSLIETTLNDTNRWIETPSTSGNLTSVQKLDDIYFDLVNQRNDMLNIYTPESRQVTDIDKQIERLRIEKASNLTKDFSLNIKVLAKKMEAIENEILNNEERLSYLNSNEQKLNNLVRNNSIIEKNLLNYKSKAEDLRISDDLNYRQITSVRVINPAIAPAIPSFPKNSLILGLALALGVFFAFTYMVLAEYFDHTFSRKEEVEEKLGIPLLLSIPEIQMIGTEENQW